MAITGRPDGPPLGPPDGLVAGLHRSASVLRQRSASLGLPLELDAVALLGERAAIGVPPRNAPAAQPQVSQGLISMASHTTSAVGVDRK